MKLLAARGHELRLPHSRALGHGLYELRDVATAVRLFYILLPGNRAVLLDGITKKRDDIPIPTMRHLRALQGAVLMECADLKKRTVVMPLTKGTINAIDQRTADDPAFDAAVEAELAAMNVQQELVALRTARNLSQRQVADRMKVTQPVIAKIETGTSQNIGLATLVRYLKAVDGHLELKIMNDGAARRPNATGTRRVVRARQRHASAAATAAGRSAKGKR